MTTTGVRREIELVLRVFGEICDPRIAVSPQPIGWLLIGPRKCCRPSLCRPPADGDFVLHSLYLPQPLQPIRRVELTALQSLTDQGGHLQWIQICWPREHLNKRKCDNMESQYFCCSFVNRQNTEILFAKVQNLSTLVNGESDQPTSRSLLAMIDLSFNGFGFSCLTKVLIFELFKNKLSLNSQNQTRLAPMDVLFNQR